AEGGAARQEAGDGGGRGGVGEGGDGRIEQVDRLATERAEQQRADQGAVVHVQPLGRRDQHPGVAGHRVQRGGQEEVNVQPGQAARGQAVGGRGGPQPVLPLRRDLMVAHVRRGGEEKGGGCGGRGGGRRPAPGAATGSPRG